MTAEWLRRRPERFRAGWVMVSAESKAIRVRMAQGGSSTWTTLLGTSGQKVTKTVSVGYHPRGSGTLWFEPRGDSTTTGRTLYYFMIFW